MVKQSGHQTKMLLTWAEDITTMLDGLQKNIEAREQVGLEELSALCRIRDDIQEELEQTVEEGILTVLDEILDLTFGIIDHTVPDNRPEVLGVLLRELRDVIREIVAGKDITLKQQAVMKSVCDDILAIYLQITDPGEEE